MAPRGYSSHSRGPREIEGDEERAVELGQGCSGELAPPTSESRSRQRPDLLAEGNGIHVEAAVWCSQEDLTRVEPTPRTKGRAWHDDDHRTGGIDGITT